MTSRAERPAVLALVRDPHAAARITEALRPGLPGAPPQAGAHVRCVTHVRAVVEALAERPYALVVVDARDAEGVSTEETIRAVRRRHPDVAVVGHASARAGLSADALALARAGVHELVITGIDDAAAVLRAALARAARRSSAERILAAVGELVPEDVLPLVRYCLEHAAAAPTVPEVARALGVSRQTLAARLRAAGLPAPRELAVWCRLLLAADLLAGGGRTVDQVALALDFPSANAFRNVLRRHAGVGPADLRAGGACLVTAFRATLAAPRPPTSPVAHARRTGAAAAPAPAPV
jgi:AraC-like DNA-binding protein